MVRYCSVTEVNPPLRVVFAVGSKLGDAHIRNRIKRRLREALFTVMKASTNLSTGFDIAIIPKKDVATVDYALIVNDLEFVLRKLRR